jgi:hypothetical protein
MERVYCNDMMHCHQTTCKLKDECYRYWLGENIKNTEFTLASYFYPKEPVVEGCRSFVKLD